MKEIFLIDLSIPTIIYVRNELVNLKSVSKSSFNFLGDNAYYYVGIFKVPGSSSLRLKSNISNDFFETQKLVFFGGTLSTLELSVEYFDC